ncbi:MAG: hypothetical protein Q9228_007070, partial [Teloschistes exilis]
GLVGGNVVIGRGREEEVAAGDGDAGTGGKRGGAVVLEGEGVAGERYRDSVGEEEEVVNDDVLELDGDVVDRKQGTNDGAGAGPR